MAKKIADISHYHPVKDWGKVKESCSFLISKATQHTNYIDSTLDSFIKGCEKYKIPYWLYVYLEKGNENAQAEYMIKICKGKIGSYFVGYILDVEDGNSASNVKSALSYINGLGYKTMLYTMYADYKTYVSVIANRGDNCAWWEARYGKNNGKYNAKYPCHSGVELHQYTSLGTCSGVSGSVDLNRVTGNTKKDLAWFTTPLKVKSTSTNTNSGISTTNSQSITRENFLKSCRSIANIIMSDKNWKYSASTGLANTFEKARTGNRYTSCANYVNFAMQDCGTLKSTMRFYTNDNGEIVYQSSDKYTKNDVQTQMNKYYKTITLNRTVADLKGILQQGDICCWKGHTNVFAGYNDGKAMFYDAGKGSTSDGKPLSGVFTKMYRTITRTDKIQHIIRLKDEYTKLSIAKEVINGKWGSGAERKTALTKAFYDYDVIQKAVNVQLDTNKKTSTTSNQTTSYYKKYNGKSVLIDTVLKAVGVPEKYRGNKTKRKPIAVKNEINNYKGSTSQNLKLIKLAKSGKLKKV